MGQLDSCIFDSGLPAISVAFLQVWKTDSGEMQILFRSSKVDGDDASSTSRGKEGQAG